MSTYETRNKTLCLDADTPNIPADIRAIRRLWAAVMSLGLQDAAYEYKLWASLKDPSARDPRTYPAIDWMESDSTHKGGFVWICEDVFNIDPERARNAWRANIRAILKKAKEDACALHDSLETELSSPPVSSEPPSTPASKPDAPSSRPSARKSRANESSAPSTPKKAGKSASTQQPTVQ